MMQIHRQLFLSCRIVGTRGAVELMSDAYGYHQLVSLPIVDDAGPATGEVHTEG
jgi:hypothetical protein